MDVNSKNSKIIGGEVRAYGLLFWLFIYRFITAKIKNQMGKQTLTNIEYYNHKILKIDNFIYFNVKAENRRQILI